MTQPILIGLTGRAGVGKDTAGDYLVAQHGFARYAFADPIKAALCAMLGSVGLSPQSFAYRELKEHPLHHIGKSPRQLAQTLGTEWGRNLVHPDLWLILAEMAWRDIQACGAKGLVITDVRFDNEAEWIRNQGGKVICIARPQAESVSAHASEAGVSAELIDLHLMNAGTVKELHARLDMTLVIIAALIREDNAA